MKLKLIQTGGLVGKRMAAQVSCKLKEEEWAALLAIIQKKATRSRARDAHNYVLQKDNDEKNGISIDINAIPPEHASLFQKLFEGLKVID
jgi:hypothetical protein